jgi:hypothetical protein
MVQDLSHLAENSIWATSQHSGNRPSDNSTAMTAPGTPSPAVDTGDVSPQPFVQPAGHERTTVTDGNEPTNSTPYNRADGTPWTETDVSDDIITGGSRPRPPMVQFGRWNSV